MRFIWHGEWADPEVRYKNRLMDETELSDYFLADFLCECRENGEYTANFQQDNQRLTTKNNLLKFHIMKKEIKQTIWDSELYFDEESMNEWAKENVAEGIWDEMPTADELRDMWREDIDDLYSCESHNLNRQLGGFVICVADLGFWNGRRIGIKRMGTNLNEVLNIDSCCDIADIYCDGYNVRLRQSHHDGTNYLLYRLVRYENEAAYERMEQKARCGELAFAEVMRNSESLYPYVAEVYGWELRHPAHRRKVEMMREAERRIAAAKKDMENYVRRDGLSYAAI